MLFASTARKEADKYQKENNTATIWELRHLTNEAVTRAAQVGEYHAKVICYRYVPRELRKEYKRLMKELGYRVSCDWDDYWASIIHIRW